MNTKHGFFKTISIFMILSLAIVALGGIPVQAAQTSPESAPPSGLNASDWSQIHSLLRGNLPVQQAYVKASNTGSADNFGMSVAVDGDTLVVGTPYEDSNATGVNGDQNNNSASGSGVVYVFTRSGTTWSQQAYLKASNTEANDYFGWSIAIDGDTLVVGAYGEDSNATGMNGDQSNNSLQHAGAVYIFVRSGTTWSQQAYLKSYNPDTYDYFGYSLSIDGDTLAVGAYGEDGSGTGVNGIQNNSADASGAAYVFTRTGVAWSQQAYVKASNTASGDQFGLALCLSGDTLVVGAWGEDSNATGVNGDQGNNSASGSGAAYVFTRSGTDWSQQAYIKASNTGVSDEFSKSMDLSGDTLVVGAAQEDSYAIGVNGDQTDNSSTEAGAAYVFVRSGTTWSQQAYLKASNTFVWDQFGKSVRIDGNTVVVGAVYEDSYATGVNGNWSDDLARDSGAAYLFTRSGTNWSQQAYLKASNTDADDFFGVSLDLSGGTVVVGANGEDSNATGVNGNQGDNSMADPGAAYVFVPDNLPTDISLSNSSVAENKPVGTAVGTLTTTDPDAGDTHTYLLACATPGADDASFQINGSTLQTNAVFNYESKNSYAICIRTDDGHGGTYDENFNISVTDVFEGTATFSSIGAYDGHILESGETSNVGGTLDSTSTTFYLGDGAGDKQYRGILSFNTASLPDTAVITKVTLKIKKQGGVGTNPFTLLGGLKVDMRKPFFGTTLGLVVNDFQSVPGKSAAATFSGTPVANWYSALLNAVGRAYVNKTGTTQFRLRFATDDNNDNSADYMTFFSGNYAYATSRPTLIIEYYVP